MAQQQKLARRDHQQPAAPATGDSGSGPESITGIHGEKRKHRVLDFESDDDDDFAGFDDDASSSENGVIGSPKPSITNSKKPSLSVSPGEENSSFSALDRQDDMDAASVGSAGGGHHMGAAMGGVLFDANSKAAMMAAAAVKRKVVPPVNAQDEAFRIPFKYGWKRELVYRANMDGNSKDKGEVYYITPAGKKLRTRNDIVMALHDGLTMDNFTFIKDPVGGSPDEEIIRSAKSYGSTPRRSANSTQGHLQSALPLEIPIENNSLGKRIPKPKMPKGASPPHASSYGRSSFGQTRTSPPSRINTQPSLKSTGSVPIGRVPSLGVSGFKPNENAFSATKSSKLKNKLEESRKSLINTKPFGIGSQQSPAASSNGGNRSYVAADLAAIRSEAITGITVNSINTGAGQHSSSSIVAGLEQNRLFASNFFSNVSIGYDVLQQTFQYLKVQELLRASCVCRMWNQVANHPRLWRTVRMKNSHVNDWAGLASTLRNNGTKHLDLRKMLISGNSDEMWQKFINNIAQVDRLERIDLCRCSSTIVGSLLKSNPYLKVINALAIKNDPIDFANFEHGKHLQELRLKSSAPVSVDGDLAQLGHLQSLRHLSLTSILKLGSTSIEALGNLKNLESLELGECTEIGQNLADTLTNLSNLQRLRLEKGQDNFNMFTVLDGISKLPNLIQLELINCDVKVGFDKQIYKCSNIKKLLLIPTYVSQSAATNHMVLSGVAKLCDTLETFIWTVTVELLRVTELYIDQCDTKNREDKNSPGESIPILKPVPGTEDAIASSSSNSTDTPAQVEIVPLTTVTSILDRSLPNTKLKILKIPFASTWKQGMIELP